MVLGGRSFPSSLFLALWPIFYTPYVCCHAFVLVLFNIFFLFTHQKKKKKLLVILTMLQLFLISDHSKFIVKVPVWSFYNDICPILPYSVHFSY